MKKIATSIIAVALLLSVTATGVFAAQGAGRGRGFVDADSDGVCDYYGTGVVAALWTLTATACAITTAPARAARAAVGAATGSTSEMTGGELHAKRAGCEQGH